MGGNNASVGTVNLGYTGAYYAEASVLAQQLKRWPAYGQGFTAPEKAAVQPGFMRPGALWQIQTVIYRAGAFEVHCSPIRVKEELNMKSVSQAFALVAMMLLAPLAMAQSSGLSPVEATEQSVNQLLGRVQELRPFFNSDRERYYVGIEEELNKFVDFREVAVGVMARYSQQATEDQIVAFGEKLRSTLTRFYGSALVEYGGQKLTFLPAGDQAESSSTATVRMQLENNGSRIELQYALFQNAEGEWKLRNIFVGGVNLRRQYNTQFAALMNRHNNDIDQVIQAWQ